MKLTPFFDLPSRLGAIPSPARLRALLSVWHWAVLVGRLLGGFVPLFLFQRRLGQSGILSFLAIIPLGILVALWVLAFSRWEREA